MEILIKFSILFCFLSLVTAPNPKNWKPGYKTASDQYIKQNRRVYYAEDGTCGWLYDNEYVKPVLDTLPGGHYKCLRDFHQNRFGPICGDPYYPYVKHCAKVDFFNNLQPEANMMLALLDGCAVCNAKNPDKNKLEMSLVLKWTWPRGTFYTGCYESDYIAGQMNEIKFAPIENHRLFPKAGYPKIGMAAFFALPGDFFQRHCEGWFSFDEILTSYNNIRLVVKHNCGGKDKSFEVKLPDLITKNYEYHIAEMRGLRLDLDKEMAQLYNLDPSVREYKDEMHWGNWYEFKSPDNARDDSGSEEV